MHFRSLLPQLALTHLLLGSTFGAVLFCTTACELFLPLAIWGEEPLGPLVAPVPPSEVITGLSWDDSDEVRRGAKGSDNWPLTWADDGHLYTAYGDGWGFRNPDPGRKLSLGFVRVEGEPYDFDGFDIPSNGEQLGQGRRGKKASGMLMVDGTLYMWVRNANNNGQGCQLAASSDYAVTWAWNEWTFPEFGYCTFVNFGRNYEGAIDDYVYMVTPDGSSAYEYHDGFVLTRVPKEEILNRDAYEFFTQLSADGPEWTTDIAGRRHVFSNRERSRRNGMSYNQDLGRFIWWQGLPSPDGDGEERFSGGFGVYEAPMPWGPWRTVYFTPDWDIGPGETASFPPKWMENNGLTMHLVFSGDDYFAVRKARLTLAD